MKGSTENERQARGHAEKAARRDDVGRSIVNDTASQVAAVPPQQMAWQQVGLDIQPTPDGRVVIQVVNQIVFTPEVAESVAKRIMACVTQAKTGLVIPDQPKGRILLPGQG